MACTGTRWVFLVEPDGVRLADAICPHRGQPDSFERHCQLVEENPRSQPDEDDFLAAWVRDEIQYAEAHDAVRIERSWSAEPVPVRETCRRVRYTVPGVTPAIERERWEPLVGYARFFYEGVEQWIEEYESWVPVPGGCWPETFARWCDGSFDEVVINDDVDDIAAALVAKCEEAGLREVLVELPVTNSRNEGSYDDSWIYLTLDRRGVDDADLESDGQIPPPRPPRGQRAML